MSWSQPALIGSTNAAHMLPAAVGGPKGGQLAIGFFRTVNGVTSPNSTSGKWTYATAESTNTTAGQPRFTFRDVNPGFVYHNGQICNAGILCGFPASRATARCSTSPPRRSTPTAAHCPPSPGTGGVQNGTSNYVTRQRVGCFTTKAAKKPAKRKPATQEAKARPEADVHRIGAALRAASVGPPIRTREFRRQAKVPVTA